MTDKTTNPAATAIDALYQIPTAARDFVQRTAASAQDRAASVHSGAEKVATALQDAVNVSVNGYALVGRSLMQGAYQNVESTLGMVQKLAGAKCLGDAIGVQLDFLRDYGKANVEQFRATADVIRKSYADSDKAVRTVFAKPEAPAA
ncbi:phasin family protein [Reyranella sp. CPCC 100927]|uniref:phasin family protein n=1 Tax=Reyranella sp. CPCC 100927 TaxID=2599616 RepID=UPI0015B6DA1F|nr:phasin family protein [Reyranella sp. CPCC 100927]